VLIATPLSTPLQPLSVKLTALSHFFRTLSKTEASYPIVEKEALTIIESVRYWSHFLHSSRFLPVTDQKALSFMFCQSGRGKIKNTKLQVWRAELGNFEYDIVCRPGRDNVVPDALSRTSSTSSVTLNTAQSALPDLTGMHKQLGPPGVTRLLHFVRTSNLPFSASDICEVCGCCRICAELKPSFVKKTVVTPLLKATHAWERLSIDFKGPVKGANPYFLIVVDEYSRFPFAFACRDQSTPTVIKYLSSPFALFGYPQYIHSDKGSSFMSAALKQYLVLRGIATSRSTPYHPQGNSQCERINQTVWSTVKLMLCDKGLSEQAWETILPEALHSVRSLLCTATNATPHERFLPLDRRSMLGRSLPSWLIQPVPVMLRKFVRNKSEPPCEEVELLEANPTFAYIRFPDVKESSVSIKDLSRCPSFDTSSRPPSKILQIMFRKVLSQNLIESRMWLLHL